MLFSSRFRVRVRIRFNVWLVNDYAHVFTVGYSIGLLSVVNVTLPIKQPQTGHNDSLAVVRRKRQSVECLTQCR